MFDLPDVLGLSSAASPEKTTNGHHQNGNVCLIILLKLSTFLGLTDSEKCCNDNVKVKRRKPPVCCPSFLISSVFCQPSECLGCTAVSWVLANCIWWGSLGINFHISCLSDSIWLPSTITIYSNKHSYSFQLSITSSPQCNIQQSQCCGVEISFSWPTE